MRDRILTKLRTIVQVAERAEMAFLNDDTDTALRALRELHERSLETAEWVTLTRPSRGTEGGKGNG